MPSTSTLPPASASPAISAQGLHRRFGELVAVKSLDLEIRRGECFGLLGPNGAGKTTTIEILEGLQRPDAGTVRVLGMAWDTDAARIRPRLGIQLQETQLSDRLRVDETLRLFRAFYPTGPSVEQLLDHVQLNEKRTAWTRDLSGGQRQRLSVACALAGDPDLLFLDEPTTGLDPQSRRALWDVCERFRAGGGTILLTTHFMDEAEHLADRIAIMDHGEILVQGTPRELVATLGGAHVIEFEPTVPLEDARLAALPGVQSVTARGAVRLLAVDELHRSVPGLMALLDEAGGELVQLHTHRATLDDVFLARTGRQLRED